MIHIDRNQSIDNIPILPSQAWFDLAADKTNDAKNEGATHKVTDLYKDVEIKTTLEKLFHNKCAYCETVVTADSPWDVEHYRPKGAVAERDDHPGYYWLAYTWDNLLPSCVFCNQSRKDQPLFDDPDELPSAGKKDQFPVEDEANRVMAHDSLLDLAQEKPLLLNPCIDHPENHFTYNILGEIVPLDQQDKRATKTIKICNLQRRRLRDQRRKRIQDFSKMLKLAALIDPSDVEAKKLSEEILDDFTNDAALYAGACRAVRNDPVAFNGV